MPNVFNYISKTETDLSFPETPFFLYKLTTNNGKDTDWENSIYMNMSFTNITVKNWNFDTVTTETGIMLVESI
jgi:hypothetical protein